VPDYLYINTIESFDNKIEGIYITSEICCYLRAGGAEVAVERSFLNALAGVKLVFTCVAGG
jgi:hypothetical protein